MPIVINLLAEEQAAEELRRRDPLKKAIWIATCCALLSLLLVGYYQMKLSGARKHQAAKEAEWAELESKVRDAKLLREESIVLTAKYMALQQYAANRFLWGPTLDVIQNCMIPDIRVMSINSDQRFSYVEPVKATEVTPAKPGECTEALSIIIKARDDGPSSEQKYNMFREKLASHAYYKEIFNGRDGVTLDELSPPIAEGGDPNKTYVLFRLKCALPPITRKEIR